MNNILKCRVHDTSTLDLVADVVSIRYDTEDLTYKYKDSYYHVPFTDVVMMYSTGYKDDSNAEIFDGDILVDDEGYIIGYVEMDEGCWCVDGVWLFDVVSNGCLIRGNKFENKELLEE